MKDFIKKTGITEKQFFGTEKIGGSLYLSSLTSIPEGFNPTVGGSLDLSSLTSIPEGFNPTVGGYLYLSSLTSIPEGFNPTVGGSLYLSSLTSIPEGFNPTVGGYLDLRSLTSIPEGLGYKDVPEIGILQWKNGKYIFCDGRFSEVVSNKKGVYKLKDVNKEKYYYLVTDGNGKFAHGDSVKDAKEDLIYKISDRDKSKYEGIDMDKKHSFSECIEMYRVITGACSTGTRNFIESKGIKKESLSVNEIISITKGNYGAEEFKSFFNV